MVRTPQQSCLGKNTGSLEVGKVADYKFSVLKSRKYADTFTLLSVPSCLPAVRRELCHMLFAKKAKFASKLPDFVDLAPRARAAWS